MGRKIVLLSDGTGNSSAKVWRTNVWRVFESLDLSGSDQVAFYDDGVGTAAFKPLAILGGAFGWGLRRNVIDLYKFAWRNYRNDDDEIFGFGFSRGAFTMRVVTGLILEQGLIKADSEAELHAKAKAAYRTYRANNYHTIWHLETAGRLLLRPFTRRNYDPAKNRKSINIRFLGLWDTVAAYGMPVEEMTRGISQWIWPLMLPGCHLDDRVQRACHALSVDDERTTFHPVLWDERKERPLKARPDGRRYLADERISQVWFPGVHSNVGGGYPDDSVAQIPLVWIMSEAKACGLAFKSSPEANPQTYDHPGTVQDKDGRIYDPRAGLGGYYRYGPRDLTAIGKELLSRQGAPAVPRIHESVLKRIQNRAHSYASKGLPAYYEVVTGNGEVLPPDKNPYEPVGQEIARWHAQEKIWNTIWLRRIVYFLTVGVSIYLFAFPLMKATPAHAEFESKLRWVSDIVRTLGAFLPDAADTWINAYARQPARFSIVVIVLVAMMGCGSWLSGKIQSSMDSLWRRSLGSHLIDTGKPTDFVYSIRTSKPYRDIHWAIKRGIAPFLFAVLFVYLGLTFASHVAFNIQDHAGLVCREWNPPEPRPGEESKKLETLGAGEAVTDGGITFKLTEEQKQYPFRLIPNLPVFETKNLCQSMKVTVERGRTYLIRFERTKTFRDDWIDPKPGAPSYEFYFNDPPSSWHKALVIAGLPLRRELLNPWFRAFVRFGGNGGEEKALKADTSDRLGLVDTTFKATRDGELFLFINDAVVGIPGLYNFFYRNNLGSTKVLVRGL